MRNRSLWPLGIILLALLAGPSCEDDPHDTDPAVTPGGVAVSAGASAAGAGGSVASAGTGGASGEAGAGGTAGAAGAAGAAGQ